MSASAAIDAAVERSDLVRVAFEVASRAHTGQVRNASGGRPYIDHPVMVADKLSDGSEQLIAAALLHDVVEDTELEVDDIREFCGAGVAELVAVLSDDEGIEDYEERKREHRGRVAGAGDEALAIYAADKLTNVSMLRDAYRGQGESVSDELKVPLDTKIAVWDADLRMLEADDAKDARAADLTRRLGDALAALAADRGLPARG